MILSVDPGDMSGYCILNWEGHVLDIGQLNQEGMNKLLADAPTDLLDLIIVEDFKLFKHKAQQQSGSRFTVVKIIGAIELFAQTNNIPIVLQAPQCKDRGAQFSQMFPPSNHAESHKYDAFNHAYYYLVRHHKIKTVLERKGYEKLK